MRERRRCRDALVLLAGRYHAAVVAAAADGRYGRAATASPAPWRVGAEPAHIQSRLRLPRDVDAAAVQPHLAGRTVAVEVSISMAEKQRRV